VLTKFEKLVSAHQLISFPSEAVGFNRAYEGALRLIESSDGVEELYVVQYRSSNMQLCFCSVPHSLISSDGPYRLTYICAVVRKPRLILHADCTA